MSTLGPKHSPLKRLINVGVRSLASQLVGPHGVLRSAAETDQCRSSCGRESGKILGQTSDIFISDEFLLQFKPLSKSKVELLS